MKKYEWPEDKLTPMTKKQSKIMNIILSATKLADRRKTPIVLTEKMFMKFVKNIWNERRQVK
jgi:hypothetical protein